MKIIKVHGCSGAGKSTAVRSLLTGYQNERRYSGGGSGKLEGYVLQTMPISTYVLGSYVNPCGGADTVPNWEEVVRLIDKYYGLGFNVVHEGLLQSTYYGKMGFHSRQFGNDYIYAFMDTPADQALANVMKRRAETHNNRAFDPQKTLDKHRTVERLKDGLIRDGLHRVVVLKYAEPMLPQLLALLEVK